MSADDDQVVPIDLIDLEFDRREQKARHDASAGSCRYALHLAEQSVARHPWLVERKTSWRAAREALREAADAEFTIYADYPSAACGTDTQGERS